MKKLFKSLAIISSLLFINSAMSVEVCKILSGSFLKDATIVIESIDDVGRVPTRLNLIDNNNKKTSFDYFQRDKSKKGINWIDNKSFSDLSVEIKEVYGDLIDYQVTIKETNTAETIATLSCLHAPYRM
jgi:hypothetical protein